MAKHRKGISGLVAGVLIAGLCTVTVGVPAAAAAPTITEFTAGITATGNFLIATGADGNLWFPERDGDAIGRITPSGTVTEFSTGITGGAAPFGVAAGPDGNIW